MHDTLNGKLDIRIREERILPKGTFGFRDTARILLRDGKK
jgi:hypothetical protein